MNSIDLRDKTGMQGPGAAAAGSGRGENTVGIIPLIGHYLAVARKRRWLILGVIGATLAAALIVTLLMTPQYTARSTIEIRREGDNIVRVEGVQPEATLADMEFYQTQYGLLQSRSLAERVAIDLRLFDDPTFFALFGYEPASEWFEDGRVKPTASTRQQRVAKAADILLANVSVSPIRLSRLVHLSFTSPDPDFSARIVNEWGERFIRTTLERRFEATSYARQFLEQRLGQLRQRLDQSERQLVRYAAREGIVNLPNAGTGGASASAGERPLAADELAAASRELAQARSDRIRAQSRLQAPGGAVAEALENQAITGLRQRRAQLNAEYSKMMVQFEPSYPPAMALKQEVEQLDTAIAREEARVRSSLQANAQASATRERNLSGEVSNLKDNLLDVRRRSIQYNIYQREVDTNSQLYDALLQRYKEIGVAGGVGVNNISVVDPAQVPQVPSSPRLLFNLVIAWALGIGLGFALALILEQIDDAISDPSELEALLNIPVLGATPKSKGDDPYELLEDRKSDLSEAYLAVQTSLAFATDHGAPSSMAVTSTRPGEGKSTTAYAVARLLARSGKRVVLVDGDMRSPSVHHHVRVTNEKGLSNYLTGNDNLSQLVVAAPNAEMAILPAGPQPPSAAELLGGGRLKKLIKQLQTQFDHVVIDSPPVMGLADAPLLASHVEGTIFVIESHNTKIGPAKVAVNRLAAAQAHLIGAVLTKFEPKRATYGYDYGYGYGYGRGTENPA